MAVKIIVDSTSYIPKKLIEELDIRVVSLNIIFDALSFKETELTNNEFYRMLDEFGEIPKSSQPSVDELYNVFKSIIEVGDSIVAAFISSEMSGTFQTANLVRNMIIDEFPNAEIKIIDSRSNCMQLGFVAMVGAQAAKERKSIEEVYDIANAVTRKSRFIFLPESLTYLKKGGRIGSAKALLGNVLQIKPILTVNEGKTDLIDSVRTKKKAVNRIIEMCVEEINKKGLGQIAVHHINCYNEAFAIAELLKIRLSIENILICSIGPVIGTHVGPGAVGIAYYTIKE